MGKTMPSFPLSGARGAQAPCSLSATCTGGVEARRDPQEMWDRAAGAACTVGHRGNASIPPQQPPASPPSAWKWSPASEESLPRDEKSLPWGCFAGVSQAMHKLGFTSSVNGLKRAVKMSDHVTREWSGSIDTCKLVATAGL